MKIEEINTQKISSIKLPLSLRNGRVFVLRGKDILIIKKSPVSDFTYVREKLRGLKNKISQKDIDKAVQAARG